MAVLGIKSIVAKKCKPLKAGKKYGTEREYYEQWFCHNFNQSEMKTDITNIHVENEE